VSQNIAKNPNGKSVLHSFLWYCLKTDPDQKKVWREVSKMQLSLA